MPNIYLKVYIENLKNQRSGGKTMCDFSNILILKGIMTSKSPCFFVEQKYKI